jgi:hypothetical protein
VSTSSDRTVPTEELFEFAAGVSELALAVSEPDFSYAARFIRLSEFIKQWVSHR